MEQTVRQQLSDYIVAHQEEFYRLAYSYVKNRDAALDVVQESIVKALAKSDTLRRPRSLPWPAASGPGMYPPGTTPVWKTGC